MEDLKLNGLNLPLGESRYIIEFLARKRCVNNYKRKSNDELLSAIKSLKNMKKAKITNNNKSSLKIKKNRSDKKTS